MPARHFLLIFNHQAAGKILITAASVREWPLLLDSLAIHELVINCFSILFVALKGVFLNSAVVLLATSLCQALCLQPDGSCIGVGNQSEKSYWKVHKISAGICMFESVKNARMYLRIKDGQCDGTVSKCLRHLQ